MITHRGYVLGAGARRLFRLAAGLAGLALLAVPAGAADRPRSSNRLIVEFSSPPVSGAVGVMAEGGRLRAAAPEALAERARIEAEQAAFAAALPGAAVATYRGEAGRVAPLRYSLVFNGMTVDPGTTPAEEAERVLRALPGVKAVYRDWAHEPTLYASLPLIGAPELWIDPAIGGAANAGAGVKVASMDGGVHHAAPMFDGTGYAYPAGGPYPLGDPLNNNGKIIVSRAYFRATDPPVTGDANTWPVLGTSHGVHTAGIAAGNAVTASYLGTPVPMSGTAPRAYVMSYRVFYQSQSGDTSFYTAEGLQALQDIVADGADVLNNSWGKGPVSSGGALDPLDAALLNAVNAGVFLSMSAGNSGPGPGTSDHPSSGYVTVAATTSGGSFADGRLAVTAPEPVSDPTLQDLAFAWAQFGEALSPGDSRAALYLPAYAVNADHSNTDGCLEWPAGTFAGRAAVIERGGVDTLGAACQFGLKALNAQNAGATLVVIYNHAAGGDALTSMSGGTYGSQVTIPAVFIGRTDGLALIDWHAANGAASGLTLDSQAHQVGNLPDRVADFSSRGPGVGNVLKPDIAAPGVDILSQGYTTGATGQDVHLGYGQASGTSMAAPHVAGGAALVLQAHPDWTPAMVKSALMSTARYLEIYNADGSPAQPLDVGAGQLDLRTAVNPGVVLSPPSLGFGAVASGTRQLTVTVTNVSGAAENYVVSTLGTRDGFGAGQLLQPLPGFSVSPDLLSLAAGQSAALTVTFDAAGATAGIGDQQGYVVLDGETHQGHFPVWARLIPAATADVLLIDNDDSLPDAPPPPTGTLGDYRSHYTVALTALGYSFDVVDLHAGETLPDGAKLSTYRAVVYFSGDNYITRLLPARDMDLLTEYANNGGAIVSTGQDATDTLAGSFFLDSVLGAYLLADSVSGGSQPTLRLVPAAGAPPAFAGLSIDVGGVGDGAHNQRYIDHLIVPPWVGAGSSEGYAELLRYPDPAGSKPVAVSHREQPSLERRGVTYRGRSIHAAFGLEGVNDDQGGTTRATLLRRLLDWTMDKPAARIRHQAVPANPNASDFIAVFASNVPGTTAVRWRWDFGDGTPYQTTTAARVRHTYARRGNYTVTVEVTDNRGNRTLATYRRLTGALTVTLGPAGARLAGARWRLDRGPWQRSGATIAGIPIGRHTVRFLPLSGWTAPARAGVIIRYNVRQRLNKSYR